MMAGGGNVLWSIGNYDASNAEFPGAPSSFAPYTLKVPALTKVSDVPGSLYGGLDALDGLNEPLVLELDTARIFADDEKFFPEFPDFEYIENDQRAKRKSVRSSRLLLLGLAYDYVDEATAPEIVVRGQGTEITRQKIIASTPGRHAYVMRVWIQKTLAHGVLQIENVAPFGCKVDIDFIAMIGPGDRVKPDVIAPSISFTGTPEAELFSRQLAVSKFFADHYFADENGEVFSSLPGGARQEAAENHDMFLLMIEQAKWGNGALAKELAPSIVQRVAYMGTQANITQSVGLDHPLAILPLYETWKANGYDNQFLKSYWLPCVLAPANDITKQMASHPLGLIFAKGEYGVNGEVRGSTRSVSKACELALRAAADMANAMGYGQSAQAWVRDANRLAENVERQLITRSVGERVQNMTVFEAAHGLASGTGVVSFPPDNWLYGRLNNKEPVLYDQRIRLYDTPYLFSSLPIELTNISMLPGEETRSRAQTTLNWMNISSPVLSGTRRDYLIYNHIDYITSDTQLWMIMAALYLDDTANASKWLDSYIRYTFDEYAPLPHTLGLPASDIEVSPYTFEYKQNVSDSGENEGGSGDDLNIQTAFLGMTTARLIAGVDDKDPQELKIVPRLPDNWVELRVNNWPTHIETTSSLTHALNISYQRLGDDRYRLDLKSEKTMDKVTFRAGPFSRQTGRVVFVEGGLRERVTTVVEGGSTWAYKTYRGVKNLEVGVSASR